MPNKKNNHDYDVGYCKPPKHSRFKRGQSGNPKGRPNGTLNLKTDLAEELAERIVISENGRRVPISKQRAMVKQLMAKALNGDVRATTTLIGMIERLMEIHADDSAVASLTADDQAILADYARRYSGQQKNGDIDVKPNNTVSSKNGNNK